MSDLSKINGVEATTETQKTLGEKGKQLLKAATAAVVLSTGIQASELLKKCDLNGNGHIDIKKDLKGKTGEEKKKGIQIIRQENKCKLNFELAQEKLAVASLDEIIEKYLKEIEEINIRIKKLDEELSKNKAELSKNKAELSKNKAENNKLRKEREEKRQRLRKQIQILKQRNGYT